MSAVASFLNAQGETILVTVREAKGSTPREAGTTMLVGPTAIHGTIGGGRLELMAIERARAILSGDEERGPFAVPLGPEIGQCCGGHVTLDLERVDAALRETLERDAKAESDARPDVYLFGAGHVGTALAAALSLLPVRVVVAETRAEWLADIAPPAEAVSTAVPEALVRDAKPGSAFIVLTHDHALDFLIASEALKRGDAAYVGMIGSKTKREVFRRQFLEGGGSEADCAKLVTPIGGADLHDKRPAVIAALTAAEVLKAVMG